MTNQESLILLDNLNKLNGLQGARFSYLISRNREVLIKNKLFLDELIRPSQEYIKFDEKRLELARSMAKLDENKRPMVIGNQFIMEDQLAFDKAFEDLKAQYPEIIEAREKQVANFNEVLKMSADVAFREVTMKDIPESITVEQFEILKPFFEE